MTRRRTALRDTSAQLQRSRALNWHVIATLLEVAGLACLGVGGVLAATVVFDGWPQRAQGENR